MAWKKSDDCFVIHKFCPELYCISALISPRPLEQPMFFKTLSIPSVGTVYNIDTDTPAIVFLFYYPQMHINKIVTILP